MRVDSLAPSRNAASTQVAPDDKVLHQKHDEDMSSMKVRSELTD